MSENSQSVESAPNDSQSVESAPNDSSNSGGTPVPREVLDEQFSKGYGKGIDKGKKEAISALLSELGVDSLETLKNKLTKPKVDREKDNMTATLSELSNKVKAYEASYQEALTKLKQHDENILVNQVQAVALQSSVLPEAVDIVVKELKPRLRWNDDRTKLETLSPGHDGSLIPMGHSLEDLLTELKGKKSFLFRAEQSSGAGSNPANQQGRDSVYKPSGVSIADRLKSRGV